MTLFHLQRIEEPDWDEHRAMVVRAPNEKKARELAQQRGGSHEEGKWLDPKITSCQKLLASGVSEIVIIDSKTG